MEQKIALVTGTSSGMGKEIAIALAKEGYLVYAFSRKEHNFGIYNIKNVVVDLKDTNSIKDAFGDIKRVDLLVNNAGYGLVSTIEHMQEEQMINQFNINVFALLRVTKYTIAKMKQNGGVIINISSFLGKIGLPLFTMYNATKYAVEGITDSLRYELKDFNIRVHSIMPGFFDTEFARSNLVVNSDITNEKSDYKRVIDTLIPTILKQINYGNRAKDVAKLVIEIVNNPNFEARATVGNKASKFIPIRKELSDEEFEDFVSRYYGI
jgi:short-subunit dehydrogenase